MIKEPFQTSVNGRHTFDIQPGDAMALDVIPSGENTFHVLRNGQAFEATLLEADHAARTYTLLVNGKKMTVSIADYYDRLVKKMGLNKGGSAKHDVVKAPMPGLALSIAVEPGQAVQKGDTLLILEAMKMENVLKAAADGVVKAVKVQKGAAVEKGQVLIEME